MPQYMILRNAAASRTESGFESFDPNANSAAASGPPEPRVETHDISLNEAVGAVRDPGVAAIALPMPIVLIEPFDSSAGTAAAGDSWGISAVQADTSSMTGNGVIVAVLDSGIDNTHPAFAGLTIMERDFSGSGNGDVQGHGTHCAGTIFGHDVDGKRIGIARGVRKALVGKVVGNTGKGSSEAIFRGIQWALDDGAHLISMSLGFDFPGAVKQMAATGMPTEPAVSSALEAYRSNLRFFDALMLMIKARAAFGETAVVVAATGNQARRPDFTIAASLPAASDGVVSVAALARGVDGKFEIAPFSNTMAQVAAPGVDILSARAGGGLLNLSGTSMACPHVAGVAALWWEYLRSTGTVRPTANLVISNLLARARTNVLAAGATPVDRGSGIVTAPQ